MGWLWRHRGRGAGGAPSASLRARPVGRASTNSLAQDDGSCSPALCSSVHATPPPRTNCSSSLTLLLHHLLLHAARAWGLNGIMRWSNPSPAPPRPSPLPDSLSEASLPFCCLCGDGVLCLRRSPTRAPWTTRATPSTRSATRRWSAPPRRRSASQRMVRIEGQGGGGGVQGP